MYRPDEYEYRIGYQYRNGRVDFSEPINESDVPKHLKFWQGRAKEYALLVEPWVEKRRVLKWERTPYP